MAAPIAAVKACAAWSVGYLHEHAAHVGMAGEGAAGEAVKPPPVRICPYFPDARWSLPGVPRCTRARRFLGSAATAGWRARAWRRR